jgi:hypothetical protein
MAGRSYRTCKSQDMESWRAKRLTSGSSFPTLTVSGADASTRMKKLPHRVAELLARADVPLLWRPEARNGMKD